MNIDQVKHKLNEVGYGRTFTVIFTKKDGTQRKITGYMEKPDGQPKQSAAMPMGGRASALIASWRFSYD